MPSRQRKRPRKDSNENGERPAPPPPAPPSLVKLLKKDKKVLEYFRSLQENLSYDVEKWKKRSHAYKEELEELKLVQGTTTRDPSSQQTPIEPGNNNLTAKDTSHSNGVNVSASQPTNKQTQIDDSAFDFELSSSSDEDDEDKHYRDDRKPQHSVASRKPSSNNASKSFQFSVDDEEEEEDASNDSIEVETAKDAKTEHVSKDKLVPKHIRIGWKFLRKAETYLNEIGIMLANSILIDENKDDNDGDTISTSDQNEGATGDNGIGTAGNIPMNATDATFDDNENETKSCSYTSYIRRSDNAVLGDIVETIKEWTKLKITVDFPVQGSDILNKTNTARYGDDSDDVAASIKNTFRLRYAAFESRERIPCFVPLPNHLLGDDKFRNTEDKKSGEETSTAPQHPAVRGVEILLNALAWIDAFGSILDEIEIENCGKNNGSESDARDEQDNVGSYYTQLVASEKDSITIDPASNASKASISSATLFVTGMKKRYVMVRRFVKSLEGEICNTWPVQDRFDWHRNTALHDDRNHSKNNSTEIITKEIWEEKRLVLDAKNSIRVAALAERCILARIVTSFHLHRSDPSSALDFLCRYILATAPSIELENYPKHPPVQSIVMIEAILNTAFPHKEKADCHRTFFDFLLHNQLKSRMTNRSKDFDPVFQVLQLALATSAFIFRIRMSHEDTRISEPGFIEEAAFRRIVSCLNKQSGVQALDILATTDNNIGPDPSLHSYNQKCTKLIQKILEDSVQLNGKTALSAKILTWTIPIASSLQGNGKKVRNAFSEWSEMYLSTRSIQALLILEGLSKALRQIEIRSTDLYRAVIKSPTTTEIKMSVQSTMARFVDLVTIKKENESENEEAIEITSLSILMRICHELADGESALRLVEWWLQCKTIAGNTAHSILEGKESSSFFNYWSAFPMVRVINLERREDRMAAFMAQTMHAGLWAIRGVITPDRWPAMRTTKVCENIFTPCIGTFAIDGSQGSPAEVERKLMNWIELGGHTNGSAKKELDSLVKPQWRPNDLRAFDMHASNDPTFLVSLSPSEKACALSHIATWKGISSRSFANSFTYTGFARGDPIHESMGRVGVDHMPPCPVALVLEDDAVLVDRFQERLDQLLEELPRDFHYCALGYARPKEAPLLDIPGCEHIKLPTMTWYLTGYLLSQSGAQYLLDHLPVEGPVDSWIGGKMILTSNWENEFGHRVGVGDAPQKGVDYIRPTLSLKEIRMCVKFRAYCAGVPLCDQKVRTATVTGASASRQEKPIQNWRLRDSDIVYSGNIGAANRKRKNHR